MRIAVNTIFLQKDKLEGYGYFVQEIFSRLARQHPEHQFFFIFDRPYDEIFIFSANVTPIVVSPAARHAFSFKYWYDVKLPLALSGLRIDVLVQPYGFCSLSTRIPQVLVVHDLAFLHYPRFISRLHLYYYKLFTPRFIRKATRVATVSQFSRQDIIQQYQVDPGKIDVVYSAAKPVFQPVGEQERQRSKDARAGGNEYFLFTGGIHPRKNLFNLLKAFSVFKKKQRSSMKLLIAGRHAWGEEDTLKKLRSYRYREDVVLLGYLPEKELAEITAGAYALIFPSFFEGFGVPVVEAMQSGVPVIASGNSSVPEIAGEAALYADPARFEEIAEQMIRLYKDETLRASLASKGLQQAASFSWDRTAALMWESIARAATPA